MHNYLIAELVPKDFSIASNFEASLGNKKSKFFEVKQYIVDNIEAENVLKDLFVDPNYDLSISYSSQKPQSLYGNFKTGFKISYKPGVTDNSARILSEVLNEENVPSSVKSFSLYLSQDDLAEDELLMASENVYNKLIQNTQTFLVAENPNKNDELDFIPHFEDSKILEYFSREMTISELLDISDERCLALNEEEAKAILEYYNREDFESKRKELGLSADMTDVELEVLSQTWSEHCKHKIFNAEINYQKNNGENKKVNSLFKDYIKKSTKDVEEKFQIPWLKSVFHDNAGVVRFDKNVDLCIKVETHNSPSALDPYGGALTGILGVNRDILGTGMGAKPIANVNMLCFGDLDIPVKYPHLFPLGHLHPEVILKGVHKGIVDGGNKSGIPTVNGSITFDSDFSGKPLVYCGTVGVMPQSLNNGKDGFGKFTQAGDLAVVIGGGVGADGIHGATFSSLDLNESSPLSAVQIGDAFTQKRVSDFVIEARNRCLFTGITDNGAGGLSSSLGEMAEKTNGIKFDLSKCTLKYPGLKPWEIMISESQERMSLSVAPDQIDEFLKLASQYSVDAQVLGEFTSSGNLEVTYQGELVCFLPLNFLHDGLPKMKLEARESHGYQIEQVFAEKENAADFNYEELVYKMIGSSNIKSRDHFVSQYDQLVQGATFTRPYEGKNRSVTQNSSVISLRAHGGEEDNAISIAHGLNPKMSFYNAKEMTIRSFDEAYRNLITNGSSPEYTCGLDNFCWPDPIKSEKNKDGDFKLGMLVETCESLYDLCLEYGVPLVSGKDSMKNDYRGKNKNGDVKISIKPTLLVTLMSKCSTKKKFSSSFSLDNSKFYLVSKDVEKLNWSLAGSEFDRLFKSDNCKVSTSDISGARRYYERVSSSLNNGVFNTMHDISEGGLITTLLEMCFENKVGAKISFDHMKDQDLLINLFAESSFSFLCGVNEDNVSQFENEMEGYFIKLGQTTGGQSVEIKQGADEFSIDVQKASDLWSKKWF
ncbi:MAG: phosphoribosylformylglycinamidine synthase [Oligoflexia bacterium]|nr:phosphoribosylformylglycinamidine synthase [Oligoflexia bacterium]